MSLETKIRESANRQAAEAPGRTTHWTDVRVAIARDDARRPARVAIRVAAAAAAALTLVTVVPKFLNAERRIEAAHAPAPFKGKLPTGDVDVTGGTIDGVTYRLHVQSDRIINLSGPDIVNHRCVKLRIDYPGKGDPFWTTGNIVVASALDCAVLAGRSAIGALSRIPFPYRVDTTYHALGIVAPNIVRLTFVLQEGRSVDVDTHPVAGYPLRAWVTDIARGTAITAMIGHLGDGRTVRLPVTCDANGWPACKNDVDNSWAR